MSKRFGRNQKRKLHKEIELRDHEAAHQRRQHSTAIDYQNRQIRSLQDQIDKLVKATFTPRVKLVKDPSKPGKAPVGVELAVTVGDLVLERKINVAFDYRAILMGQETKEALAINIAKQLVDSL